MKYSIGHAANMLAKTADEALNYCQSQLEQALAELADARKTNTSLNRRAQKVESNHGTQWALRAEFDRGYKMGVERTEKDASKAASRLGVKAKHLEAENERLTQELAAAKATMSNEAALAMKDGGQ